MYGSKPPEYQSAKFTTKAPNPITGFDISVSLRRVNIGKYESGLEPIYGFYMVFQALEYNSCITSLVYDVYEHNALRMK